MSPDDAYLVAHIDYDGVDAENRENVTNSLENVHQHDK